jgi:hypothetical protein
MSAKKAAPKPAKRSGKFRKSFGKITDPPPPPPPPKPTKKDK